MSFNVNFLISLAQNKYAVIHATRYENNVCKNVPYMISVYRKG